MSRDPHRGPAVNRCISWKGSNKPDLIRCPFSLPEAMMPSGTEKLGEVGFSCLTWLP